MHVVVKNELPPYPRNPSTLTRAQMVDQTTQALQQQFDKAYAAQQASTLTNGGLASYTGINSQGQIARQAINPYEMYRQDDNHRL
jgi:hypothetical protein